MSAAARFDRVEALRPGEQRGEPVAVQPLRAVPGVDAERLTDGLARQPCSSSRRSRSGPAAAEPGRARQGQQHAHGLRARPPPRRRPARPARRPSATTGARPARRTRRGSWRPRPRRGRARRGATARGRGAASPRSSRVIDASADASAEECRRRLVADRGGHRRSGRRSTPVASATAARSAASRASSAVHVLRPGRAVEDRRHVAALEQRPERRVDRLELQLAHRVVERGHARPREAVRQSPPLAGRPVVDLVELPEHVALVRVERQPQAALPQLARRADVGEPGPRVAERHEHRRVVRECQSLGQRAADEALRAARGLARVGRRVADRARASTRSCVW